jgi:hypothetical protein
MLGHPTEIQNVHPMHMATKSYKALATRHMTSAPMIPWICTKKIHFQKVTLLDPIIKPRLLLL